jgi:hypothetical protein
MEWAVGQMYQDNGEESWRVGNPETFSCCVRLIAAVRVEILLLATTLSGRAVKVTDFDTSRTPYNTEDGSFEISHSSALQMGITITFSRGHFRSMAHKAGKFDKGRLKCWK